MQENVVKNSQAALTIGAIGVVYGDIGTSPLYTVQTIFSQSTGIVLNATNIVGAISAIFWVLMLVVTLKYVILVLRADNKGEGGVMALLALAISQTKSASISKWLMLVGAFGAALFYGDSILTPALSVLSAVEGLNVAAPSLGQYVIPLAMLILVGLFSFQRFGTHTVGKYFGPIMIIWFVVLGLVGSWHIQQHPEILAALNPQHAFVFLVDRGAGVFLAIGAIVLAITGVEALYADMGHFGRPAIRIAWTLLVLPCLALNYLGQGALLLSNPAAVANPFYLSFPSSMLVLAIGLATMATIIASQAVISGAYSITQQAMHLGFLPRMQVIHTSAQESGQIYMPTINWFLLVAVVLATLSFQTSSAMAAAYGIAVTGTMLVTTILTFFVIRNVWHYPMWLCVAATSFFVMLDVLLLASCSVKFMNGGWFPVALGGVILTVMWTWKQGRQVLLQHIREDDPKLEPFVAALANHYRSRVERTAVFLVSQAETVPQALLHNLKHNHVLHQTNLVVTVLFEDIPWVESGAHIRYKDLGLGFWQITLSYGFMQTPDIPKTLTELKLPQVDIDPFSTSYFVSRETIVPVSGGEMALWRDKLFALMSRNAGSVVSYFNIPANCVIELGSRVHI